MMNEREIDLIFGNVLTKGILSVPQFPRGVVLFAHGTGSGRLSPRNQFVAKILNEAGFATLLMDLLEQKESDDRSRVFDITLLAERLLIATEWMTFDQQIGGLPIGYFGASTGAAAALKAAAKLKYFIQAVVSRGGRPDLAMECLSDVTAPTLLIVGEYDYPVIVVNREAFERLTAPKHMVIVPKAGHLFEEPGALEEVARLACNWFETFI